MQNSYAGGVQFLLAEGKPQWLDLATKEERIAAGQHYGHFLSPETEPLPEYLELFWQGLKQNAALVAADLLAMVPQIAGKVVVSLMRAATPYGVILSRYCNVKHYSISVMRGLGPDPTAMQYLFRRYRPDQLLFLDAWSSKGEVVGALRQHLPSGCKVAIVSDLAGIADVAGSRSDYLLPSAVLNAPVSGLVSRSFLQQGQHQAVYLNHLEPHDVSEAFVQAVLQQFAVVQPSSPPEAASLAQSSLALHLAELGQTFQAPLAQLKPGIGEASRVMLRRQPQALVVQNPHDPQVAHLLFLAQQRNVTVHHWPHMPYKASAIIGGKP